MQTEARFAQMNAVRPHPLAELLECPPQTAHLLNASAQSIALDAGGVVFRQASHCKGLYLIVAGAFSRRAERLEARVNLGPVRPGELVELAAALGCVPHTYTLSALTEGSVLLLPEEALQQALDSHPQLRMRLLEELAREVSRAYLSCILDQPGRRRHREPSSDRPPIL